MKGGKIRNKQEIKEKKKGEKEKVKRKQPTTQPTRQTNTLSSSGLRFSRNVILSR